MKSNPPNSRPSGQSYRSTVRVTVVSIAFIASAIAMALTVLPIIRGARATGVSGNARSNTVSRMTPLATSAVVDPSPPFGPGGATNSAGMWLKANAGAFTDAGGTMLATNGQNVQHW